jgi:hypothetical protein
MPGLLALLQALMPILGPLLQSLLVKKKADAIQWAKDGAQAHLSMKNTAAAFWLGTLACHFETMSDHDWSAQQAAVPSIMTGIAKFGGAK